MSETTNITADGSMGRTKM